MFSHISFRFYAKLEEAVLIGCCLDWLIENTLISFQVSNFKWCNLEYIGYCFLHPSPPLWIKLNSGFLFPSILRQPMEMYPLSWYFFTCFGFLLTDVLFYVFFSCVYNVLLFTLLIPLLVLLYCLRFWDGLVHLLNAFRKCISAPCNLLSSLLIFVHSSLPYSKTGISKTE